MRTLIVDPPFTDHDFGQEWHLRGFWPGAWVHPTQEHSPPVVIAYRKRFHVDQDITIRIHVTADERYELYLDGCRVGRGSEFGDGSQWYFETYDFAVAAGEHTFVAKVWSLGEQSPYAQMSVRHGWLLAVEGRYADRLSTGLSPWEYKRVDGVTFVDPSPAWGTGANLDIEGARYPWGIEFAAGDGWSEAMPGYPGTNRKRRNNISPSHLMCPAVLPAMIQRPVTTGTVRSVTDFASGDDLRRRTILSRDALADETPGWQDLLRGQPIEIPADTRRRVLFDLDDYYCAYPQVATSGGAGSKISLEWAESLFVEPEARTKGDRDAIEGKFFHGVGDVFRPDGGDHRVFDTLWWQAGRYVQLCVETSDQPLVIDRLSLFETRYPLEMESEFHCDDEALNDAIPLAVRSLQMCSHETYIDCPYYEQMMYSGDSRLKGLTTMVISRDDRLLRKAIDLFDHSRMPSGLTQSRYPSRVRQTILPFSLFWVGMVYDHALWRGDYHFSRKTMPGVRSVLEAVVAMRGTNGLIRVPDGWNFMDWVPSWDDGVHPGMEYGPSGIINLQVIYILQLVAELETWQHEPELAMRWKRLASELMEQAIAAFWDTNRGLFADDVQHDYFSEHAQCFAVLSGLLPASLRATVRESLTRDGGLCRTTISFSHYFFETCRELRLLDYFYQRLGLWRNLKASGFKTTPEQPEPTRSDCHGWASHPVYHFFATVLGIRPTSMGFGRVIIEPQLGILQEAIGRLVHPEGTIDCALRVSGDAIEGSILLPTNVDGLFKYGQTEHPLVGGVKESIFIARG